MLKTWEKFFKPETQHSGTKLAMQEKVALAGGSDTGVEAYVRVAPPTKVRLSSEIGNEAITASCSCPASKKGQYCKHLWAVLTCAEVKYPDFFIGKSDLVKAAVLPDPHEEKREAYRKAEYQKQKLRAKEKAGGRKSRAVKTYPEDVEAAIAYFTLNGFSMTDGLSEETLGEAKRKLSRVFHPDKGGNHNEVVELNRNWEVIVRYLRG